MVEYSENIEDYKFKHFKKAFHLLALILMLEHI